MGMYFDTDAAGTMTGWLIAANSPIGGMQIKHWPCCNSADYGYEFAYITGVGSSDNDLCPACGPLPTWTVRTVPEPGSLALLAAGLAFLALFGRRRVGESRQSAAGT